MQVELEHQCCKRKGTVPRNAGKQTYHDTASSLQAQAQGCDIQQQKVLDLLTALATQDCCLRQYDARSK